MDIFPVYELNHYDTHYSADPQACPKPVISILSHRKSLNDVYTANEEKIILIIGNSCLVDLIECVICMK